MSERLFDTVYVWSVSRVGLDSVGQGGGGWDGKGLYMVQHGGLGRALNDDTGLLLHEGSRGMPQPQYELDETLYF